MTYQEPTYKGRNGWQQSSVGEEIYGKAQTDQLLTSSTGAVIHHFKCLRKTMFKLQHANLFPTNLFSLVQFVNELFHAVRFDCHSVKKEKSIQSAQQISYLKA